MKVALPRPLMFNNLTHRPATLQRLRIGANRDGVITAIGHESWSGNLRGGRAEAATASTRLLYAGANRMTRLNLAVLDLAEGSAMRAPGEAPGMMALEIAMDELAEKLPDGSAATAHPQRLAGRSGATGAAVLQTAVGGMPEHWGRTLWLASAQPSTRSSAVRAVG